MNKIKILTCHCKKVEIELNLENGVEELVRCNCSLCKRRGYIMAKIKLENLKVKSLDERLRMKTMEKGREDLIIAGSMLVLEIMRTFDCDLLTTSEYGLREGIILDAVNLI